MAVRPFLRNARPETLVDRDSRYLVMVIDSSNMDRAAFDATIEVAKRFVKEQLTPVDKLEIVQLEDRMVVLSEFTSSRDTLIDALDDVHYRGSMRNRLEQCESAVWTALEFFENTARAKRIFVTPSAFGGGAEITADVEMAADGVLDAIHAKEMLKARHFDTYVQNMMQLGEKLGSITGSKAILFLTGGFYLESSGRHGPTTGLSYRVAERLNASNVTVYSFLAGSVHPVGHQVHKTGPFFSLGVADIFLRLEPWVTDRKALRQIQTSTGNTLFENTEQLETGPRQQAELTGGHYFPAVTPAAIEEGFGSFAGACQQYYRLGFDAKEGGRRTEILVKLVGEPQGWTLHYGKKMRETEPGDQNSGLELESAEMVLLYDGSERNDLNCHWHYEVFPLGDGRFAIPTEILVQIPAKTDTDFRIGFAALNEHREVLDIRLSNVSKINATGIAFLHDVLVVKDVPSVVRFYMTDTGNQDSSLHEERVPEPEMLPTARLHPIVLCVSGARVLPLNQMRRDQPKAPKSEHQRVALDPYLWGNQILMPRPYPVCERARDFLVLVWLADGKTDVDSTAVGFFGMGDDGRRGLEGDVVDSRSFGKGTLVLARITDKELKAGTHDLEIQVSLPNAEPARGRRPLSVLLPGGAVSVADLNRQLLFRAGDPDSDRSDLEKLIHFGADIDSRDDNGNGPLVFAVQNQNSDTLHALIEFGADVNLANNVGLTPLMLACQLGFEDGVESLIAKGADVNKPDHYGNNALHYAATSGQSDPIDPLLAAGADPHAPNRFGQTPGYLAAARGHLSILNEMSGVQLDLNQKDDQGMTILHHLAPDPSEELVRSLIDRGADLELADSEGNTPLLYAAVYGFHKGVAVFAKLGADVNRKNSAGETPLLVAAMNGNLDMIQTLMAHGADTKATLQGLNALILAAVNGHADVVKYLIASKMDPNAKCPRGYTALDYAKQANRSDVVRVLEGEEKEFDWWDE